MLSSARIPLLQSLVIALMVGLGSGCGGKSVSIVFCMREAMSGLDSLGSNSWSPSASGWMRIWRSLIAALAIVGRECGLASVMGEMLAMVGVDLRMELYVGCAVLVTPGSFSFVKKELIQFCVESRDGVSSSIAFLTLFRPEKFVSAVSSALPTDASSVAGVRESVNIFCVCCILSTLLQRSSAEWRMLATWGEIAVITWFETSFAVDALIWSRTRVDNSDAAWSWRRRAMALIASTARQGIFSSCEM